MKRFALCIATLGLCAWITQPAFAAGHGGGHGGAGHGGAAHFSGGGGAHFNGGTHFNGGASVHPGYSMPHPGYSMPHPGYSQPHPGYSQPHPGYNPAYSHPGYPTHPGYPQHPVPHPVPHPMPHPIPHPMPQPMPGPHPLPQGHGGWHQQLPHAPGNHIGPQYGHNYHPVRPMPHPPLVRPGITYCNPWAYRGPINIGFGCGWYNGFYFNRGFYGGNFCAYRHYCPTSYFFYVGSNYWWCPGNGYSWNRPTVGADLITIVVNETVQVTDPNTGAVTNETLTWYYNAYWTPGVGYVYQDHNGIYHTLNW